jgi:hypothetical protein
VTFPSKEIPAEKFFLAGYLKGKKVMLKTLQFINKTPYSDRIPKIEPAERFILFCVNSPLKNNRVVFIGLNY